MTTQTNREFASPLSSGDLGAGLVTLSGLGMVGYGILFLIRNFNGFIELGLGPEHVGVTPDQIQAFSADLHHYISHVQTATGGFIIGLGLAVTALAWFGIRSGQWWALWTAFLAPTIALGIALPLHYGWGFATLEHLGLAYLDMLVLFVGTGLSYRKLKIEARPR